MYRIDQATAAAALPTPAALGTQGYFTNGNPGTGTPATILDADFMNMVMMELMNVVTAGGGTASKTTNNQVLLAIESLIEARAGNYATDTGVANAYVIALSPAITAYGNGLTIRFRVANANTGASTVNAGGGVVNLLNDVGAALASGDLPAGSVVSATYDSTANAFLINSLVPSQALTQASADARYLQLVAGGTVSGPVTFSGAISVAPPAGLFKNLKIVASGLTNFGAVVTADELALESAIGAYFTAKNVSITPTINTSGANGLDSQAPQTCTISIATPGVVTLNNHGFPANAPVVLATTGALPTGLTAGTIYYVLNPTANTFQLSATQGGAAINTTGTQSGTQTVASAFAANCWYSVWVMYNGTTISGLLSASQTNPVLPAGYTFKARVGWVRTDGTANKYLLQTLQLGRTAQYVVLAGSNVTGMPSLFSGVQGNPTTPTWVAVGVSALVPATASAIDLALTSQVAGGASTAAMAAPNNSYGAYTSTTNPPPLSIAGGATLTMNAKGRMLLETANVYVASATSSGYGFVMGWEDNI